MGISMTMNLSTEAYNMFLSTLRLTAFTDANYNVHMVSKCMDASITIHLLVLTFDTLVMKKSTWFAPSANGTFIPSIL